MCPRSCTVTACTPAPLLCLEDQSLLPDLLPDFLFRLGFRPFTRPLFFYPPFFSNFYYLFTRPFFSPCLSLSHLHSLSSYIPDHWSLPPPPPHQTATCNITNYRCMVPLLSHLPPYITLAFMFIRTLLSVLLKALAVSII